MSDTSIHDKVVVFGPFIGEFGWETMHWMGWVNQMSVTRYAGYRKIVISYPGRSVIYPHADEFIPLPKWFLELKPSARNYILDGWVNGYPGASVGQYKWDIRFTLNKIFNLNKPHRILDEDAYDWPSMRFQAETLLSEILEQRNIGAHILICPWKRNFLDRKVYGFDDYGPARYLSQESNIIRFPNPDGNWSRLISTENGNFILSKKNSEKRKLITIFPRRRLIRREDKNWEYDKYVEVIRRLEENYPNYQVCICGEPNGAYFTDSVPESCIDLINIDPTYRLDAHIAALENSSVAFGSLSGAMFLPLMTKTPTLVFGIESEKARFENDNYLGAELRYLPVPNPSVDLIMDEIARLI